MPGPDMLIGVNMAKIAGNARMAEAQDYIDEVCAERNRAILENRRLAAKLRDLEFRLDEGYFKQGVEALRGKDIAASLRKLDPNAAILSPAERAASRRRAAEELLSNPTHGFHGKGYVYDEAQDTIRRA